MASSSSGGRMMMPSSSSSSGGGDQEYGVFLSFRGEDTRRTFVCHLYEALQRSMINAYIDSEDLDKGKRISELLIAIEDSRISIVVLSQDYASSKWCLRELAKIMECMDKKQQIVMPIFYDVDPSDVRKIEGTFAQAFAKHEADSDLVKEELESWRSALSKFGEISGWNPRDYKDDAKLIKEVVEKTDKKLIRTSSHKASGGLVGMDFHITQMHSRLCLEVNDVRVVGIWGMGGLGKTTIAQAVYDEIACQFEHSCFVHNVKEALKNKHEVGVQQDIISQLSIKEVPSGGLNRSWNTIKGRLGRKRVLIVLDDVENFSQIEEVLGEPHAFGMGSRIIVTTRDQQSPKKVDDAYHPKCLKKEKSRELLVKHAFGTDPPSDEYIDLLNQAVEYAQGLPLALKVLGASLYDKNMHEWKDVLEKIKIIPERKIMDVLRISFEGLDVLEQQIFLDIACLFRGWDHLEVTEILHDFRSHIGLENLVNRALVISKWGTLDMHDLLQEMGREIVRRESDGGPLKEPGQHSRLWNFEDIDQVLTENTATDAIECLTLELPSKYEYRDDPYCINVGAFARMTKLRVLIICPDHEYHIARGEFEFLSHELRLLVWPKYPLESLPSSIHMNTLEYLFLHGCSNLEKFPEVSNVMSELQKLYLAETAIKELPESINNLTGLRVLNLSDCRQFTTLPSSIHLSFLGKLDLSGCSNFENFPEISGIMKELSKLVLDETAIKGLPSSIDMLKGIKKLSMRNCKSLECLPDSICNLAQLTHLDLEGCNRLKSIPELSSINRLNAHCCTALETVSTPKIVCTDLDFTFSNCRQLVQTNLFTNILETRFLDQDFHPRPLSCYMCFPGSEIPNWFSHQSRGSSVTVQLPPNWFDKMFLGFAICAVSCFNKADSGYFPDVVRCYCTFKGNQGEHNFSFQLQDWDFTNHRSMESDHMFMAYVSWSKFSLAEKEESVNERYYTEATFKIVVENRWGLNERHCMTKYGVRFFHGSYMDGQNERMTNTTIPVEGLGVPFFPDQLEIRKTVTEWEAESTETAAEREGEKGSELGSHSGLIVPNSGWGAKKRKI